MADGDPGDVDGPEDGGAEPDADPESADPGEPLGDLAEAADRRGDADAPGADDAGPTGTEAPLDDLATSIDRRRQRPRESADDELFTEEDVREIDPDAVWDRLDDDGPVEVPPGEREVRVIDKDSYCERCPYFSPPPGVACGHDGTRILELVDMDHFRVVDCPKVRETEQLERL